MNTTTKIIFPIICLTVLLAACQSSWRQPVPEADIVYMVRYRTLGFVQADGDHNQILELDDSLDKPVWSKDGRYLYGLSGKSPSYLGYPTIWDTEKGRRKICDRNLPIFAQIQGSIDSENPYEVIVHNKLEIYLIDLARCKQVQILVDYSDHPGHYQLSGVSFSPVTQAIVYGLIVGPYGGGEGKVMRLDIETGEQVQLAEGISPTWSPDGTQIAYLGAGGLYVLPTNGAEPRLLVGHPFFNAWKRSDPTSFAPIPRWSPDGEALIYHRCDTAEPCKAQDAKIYKIRLSDGVEELVLLGGEFPSWR